jgi:heparanase 1
LCNTREYTELNHISCIFSYYFDQAYASLGDFLDPNILDGLQVEINRGNDATQKFAKGKQLWIGETSSAWGGGAKGLSDAYVAAFV